MNMPWQRREELGVELDDEIRAHFDMAVRDRVARGESPEAALAAARREFGNVAHVKEVTRDMWGGIWLERLTQDLRYALRSLRRSPGFAAVAVTTLALGIGVNSAMFTVMNGILLQPLPYAAPDRLFAISYQPPPGPFTQVRGLYDGHYHTFAKNDPIFEHVTTFSSPNVTLRGVGEPARLTAATVTSDFFAVFGIPPALGRVFTAGEPATTRDVSVVLSDRLWRSRFAGDRGILGRTIDIDGRTLTVIGVMPASFAMPAYTDLWIPLTIVLNPHETRTRVVVGRLRQGMTEANARAAWTAFAERLDLTGMNRTEFDAELIPLKRFVVGDARQPLLVFAGAVAFVLLIACANVANLLLMRVTTREREMAVRAALGAGRGRLIRQLLTETFLISLVGSALGIGIALAGAKMLLTIAPSEMMPRAENVRLDGWVLLFTVGLVLATTIVCGLVPAMHATEERLRASLADGARTMTGGRGRIRSALTVAEIALALVLLIGAGLMLRSFERMRRVDLGFSHAGILTAQMTLPPERYSSARDMLAFHDRVRAGLSRIPGVDAAGVVNWLPFSHMLIAGDITVEAGAKRSGFADKMVVNPEYFRAVGQRIVRGRAFVDADRLGALGVVIVSESVAKSFWPNGDAIGERISMSDKPTAADWLTVVGVVNDVIQSSVTARPDAAVYQPMAQTTTPFFLSSVSYVVRPIDGPASIATAMRVVLRAADPTLPLGPIQEMTELVEQTMLTPRFQSRVLMAFSALALVLAVIGIYGVLAYGVTQRLHEIGVRMALGAAPRDVVRIVVGRTLRLAVPGLALGTVAALALTRVLSKFLFQIAPTDPVTFAAVGSLVAAVALAAAYVPARRASRVDPVAALRPE